jgi:hypothetical protein
MYPTKLIRHAALIAPLLLLGCGEKPTPQAAPPPDIAAAAPAGAQVYTFAADLWKDPFCAGTMDWTWDVPVGQWIAFPVGWIATDEATARANWEHMQYRISLDGRALEIPDGVQTQVDSVHFECPDQTTDGVAVSRVVYFPPVDAERHYLIQYVFDQEVNDGWNTFQPGAGDSVNVTLRPGG